MTEVVGIPSHVFWPLMLFATVVACILLAVCIPAIWPNCRDRRSAEPETEAAPKGRYHEIQDAIRRSQV